ncbi:AarF domain containing kinase 2, partial [Perkinsus olseni]
RHVTETMHTMTQVVVVVVVVVSVPFPGILNIPATCLAGGKKHPQAEKTYTLLGVVSRSGLGATSGHYWAFSRPAPPCPTPPPPPPSASTTTTKPCPNQLHTANEDQSSRTIGRDDGATAPATAAVVDNGDIYPLASSSSASSSTHWWHFDDETVTELDPADSVPESSPPHPSKTPSSSSSSSSPSDDDSLSLSLNADHNWCLLVYADVTASINMLPTTLDPAYPHV